MFDYSTCFFTCQLPAVSLKMLKFQFNATFQKLVPMEKKNEIYKVSPIRKNKPLTVLTSTVSLHHYHLLEDRGNKQAK